MNEIHTTTRRNLLLAGGAVTLAAAGAGGYRWRALRAGAYSAATGIPVTAPPIVATVGTMPYRRFGATGLDVSEVSFGAWAIGGRAYGSVDTAESLRALARAEELGCNLVDTAMVYGDSEVVLGQFLQGRRNRWIVASKYSYQSAGMTATLEQQLRRLGTDTIDFYQLHSLPEEHGTYEELLRLKKSGKVRFIGASVYAAPHIDEAIDIGILDGVQLPFSLLDPDPFELRVERLRKSTLAVLIRSALKEGFLTGKFTRASTFPDPNDQRHSWSPARIAKTVDAAQRFRFLEAEAGSMVRAAVAYPLSFPEVSTVLLGTKTESQAQANFGQIPGARLSPASLQRVLAVQDELDAGNRRSLRAVAKSLLGRT
ncbi:MAG TPA: aldo/keto reductase [Steroidobacteraceae bacterium]|nr:aldo/keto reductase [Steroidobacteraceae bacterium]